MMEIGPSGNRDIESQVSSLVNGFSVLTSVVSTVFVLTSVVLMISGNFGIAGNSWAIGVSS